MPKITKLSTFVKVMQKKPWPLFFGTQCICYKFVVVKLSNTWKRHGKKQRGPYFMEHGVYVAPSVAARCAILVSCVLNDFL